MPDDRRTNALRARLEAGEVAFCALETAAHPDLVELYGDLGLDAVWIDLEHGGPSPDDGERLAELCRAAENAGTELLVRLPEASPAAVRKALDCGVRNVFVSRVEDPRALREAVAAAHFRYDGAAGGRGLANPRARRWGLADEYPETEDSAVLVGATVETQRGLEVLEDLLSVPELGFVFAGPIDLSVSMGHPGELDHPDVAAAEDRILAAARDAGVPVGGLGFGMADVNEKVDAGYRLLNLGTTTGAIRAAAEGWRAGYDGEWPGDRTDQ